MGKKPTLRRHLTALTALALAFLVCRYPLFFLHGMKDWPLLLLAAGGAVLVLSLVRSWSLVPMVVPAAYLLGFAAGVLFQTEGTDPGGGSTGSLWLIWTAVFLALTAVGLAAELLLSKRAAR